MIDRNKARLYPVPARHCPTAHLNVVEQLSLPPSDVGQLIPLLQGQILRNWKSDEESTTQFYIRLFTQRSSILRRGVSSKSSRHQHTSRFCVFVLINYEKRRRVLIPLESV